MKVLIVDDEDNLRKTLVKYLKTENWEVYEAANGLSAKKQLEENYFDAVAMDLKMPGMDGLEVLNWLNEQGPSVPVVMMSAFGDVGDAVEAMKKGAQDYLVKPFDPEELIIRLKKAASSGRNFIVSGEKHVQGDSGTPPISIDKSMTKVIELLDKSAPTDATVLITGESGTGKEVAAKYIHAKSKRSEGPFVAVNLGGLPETLIESELFGYEKGAFTGAESRKLGLFETANGGTLFLDEIGELPAPMQVKLLRALQEKKIQRLGGLGVIPIDVRIIAATNRNLEKEVAENRFREDLYYRLNVIRIEIPPLRERKDDIIYLAIFFLGKLQKEGRTEVKSISDTALKALTEYSFPGNIRELENMIERAVILADRNILEKKDFSLPADFTGTDNRTDGNVLAKTNLKIGTLKEMEIVLIKQALLRNDGHREKTAAELGISRKTLHNKIKEYGLDNTGIK